jgi:hypothetical protein
MAVKTLSSSRYSQQRLNSTNVIPASAYVPTLTATNASPVIGYLVVAGGGGGGNANGTGFTAAGGGAGGLLTTSTFAVNSSTIYVITVGAGGPAGTGSNSVTNRGSNGSSSTITLSTSTSSIVAIGGGGGGVSVTGANGNNGGSGGGSPYNGTAGLGTLGQGNNGGASLAGGYHSGGGGGAGSVGGNDAGSGTISGNGGAGTYTTFISTSLSTTLGIGQVSGNSVYFAGGGGGGAYGGYSSGGGTGGLGGGGAGANDTASATTGTAYTGGGGGGNGYPASNGGSVYGAAGSGGAGVVIIQHPNTYPNATVTGSPIVAKDGTSTVYIFTSSGSIQFLPSYSYIGVAPSAPTWAVTITSDVVVNTQLTSTGTGVLSYVLSAGSSLPAGVTLSNTGVLSGTTSIGTYKFNITATDIIGQSVTQLVSLVVTNNPVTGMTINSVFVTDSSYTALTPTRSAVSTSGGYVSIIGTGFAPNNKVYVQGVPATTSTFVSSTQINAQLPAYSTNSPTTQQIYVVNSGTNSAGILIAGFLYSVVPYWNISSSQTLVGPAISASLAALSDSAMIYSLVSGTLPSGLTLNTGTGLISGTVSAETSTSIVILATDLETQTNTQTFTLSIIISDQYWQYNSLLLNGETTVKPFNADASTNTFEVAVLGDTRPSNVNPYSNGFYSNYFNGSTDYFTVPANSALSMGTGDFTWEMWIYPTTAPSGTSTLSNQMLFGYRSGSDTSPYLSYNSGAGGTNLNVAFEGDTTTFINSNATLTLNQWNHLAVSRSGTALKMFINGAVVGSVTNSTNFSDASLRYIGAMNSTPYYFPGYISNLRIVKGTAVYTAAFTPPTAPLTATAGTGTVLLTCQSPNFIDASPIANTITKAGTPTIQSFNPFATTSTITVPTLYSVKFPASTDYLSMPINPASSGFGTGNFTVEAWIYPTAAQTITVASSFYNYSTGAGNWAFYFGVGSASTLYFNAGSAGTMVNHGSSVTTTVQINQWSHVAYSRSSSVGYFFVNGVQIGTGVADTSNYPGTAGTAFYIGRQSDGTGYLTGLISNLRIVNGIAVYTGNFTVPTSPLTVTQSSGTNIAAIVSSTSTTLLTCQSSTIVDNSSVNPGLVSAGSAQPVTATPFTQVYATPSVSFPNYYSGKFNGSTDYLSVPDNAAFTVGAGNFTFEAWVYLNNTTGSQMILGTCDSGGTQAAMSYVLHINSGTPRIGVGNGGTMYYAAAASTINANQWYHIAGVRNGASVYVYVNGVQSTALNMGALSITDSSQVVAIGRNGAYNGEYLNGYISNLRMVVGTALYTAAFTPPAAPLTATTSTVLLTCQDAVFKDNSTSAFAITTGGAPSAVGVAPFVQTYTTTTPSLTYSGSTYFDGSGDYLSSPNNSNFYLGAGDFTVDFWMYFSGAWTSNNGPGIGQKAGDAYGGWVIYRNTTVNTAYITIRLAAQGGTGGGDYANTVTPTPNTWQHWAVVRSGTTLTWYCNGVASGVTTSVSVNVTDTNTSGTMNIGRAQTWTTDFAGYLSDVRVVKGVALYTANFAPTTAPLTPITNTSLLTVQSNQAVNTSQFLDISSNSSVITRNGDTNVGTFAPFGASWSNYFDGTSGINTPAASITSIIGTNGLTALSVFTIEGWIYQTQRHTNTTVPVLIGDMQPTSTSNYWSFGPNTTGFLQFYWYDGASKSTSGSTTVPLNTWTHIAVVVNATNVKMFVNGNLETLSPSSTITGAAGTNGYIAIGEYSSGGATNGYYGYASNMRIVKAALYTASFTPGTTPLTATTNTGLLICQGPSFIDASSSATTLTVQSTPKVQRFSPFSNYLQTPITYSTKFNGSSNLSITNNTAFNFGSGAFTVELWCYAADVTTQQCLITNYGSSTTGWAIQLYNGSIGINLSGDGFDILQGLPSTNTWNHIAVSGSSGSIKLFLNGLQVGTTYAGAVSLDTAAALTIGQIASSAYFTGYISNVRVIKGTAVYTTNFTPSTTPLTAVANTSLLTLQDATFKDNSTSTFALTVTGSPTPKTFNPLGYTTSSKQSYTPAVYGGSAYFDGNGDKLTIANYPSLALKTNDFTIQAWFYTNAASTEQTIMTNGWSAYGPFLIRINASNQLMLNMSTDGGSWVVSEQVLATITTNQWYHVAVTRTSGTLRAFVNGVQTYTASLATALYDGSQALNIGGRSDTLLPMNGYISNAQIINGTSLYRANFVPPSAPATSIAGTSFLLGASPAVADFSMQNNLQTVGDAKISTAVKKFGNSSMYFDGTGDYLSVPTTISTQLGTGAYTIEAWINVPTLPASGATMPIYQMGQHQSGTAFHELNLYNNSGTLQITGALYNGSAYVYQPAVNATGMTTNTWYHVALIYNGTTAYTSFNGTLGSGSTGSGACPTTTMWIGYQSGSGSGTNYFTGYMDDFRITKGYARYSANFTTSTSAIITL